MPYGRKSCSACHGAEYHAPAPACGRCADLSAQVEDWLGEKCPPSVSGNGGCHNSALQAASACWGFYGSEGEVLAAMTRWNVGCSPPWSERELRHKVSEARKGLRGEPGFLIWRPWVGGNGNGDLATKSTKNTKEERPVEEERAVPWSRKELPFCMETLREAAGAVGAVSREILQARSVCRLDSVTPEFFLSSLYPAGSRVLVFTRFASQGQFLWEVPGAKNGGAWKLSGEPGVAATRAEQLPREGNCGVWFLNQPVDGRWREVPGKKGRDGGPAFGRRHEACVQDWPYMVLESDIKGIEGLWMSFLAGLRLPIVAMYSSGGKSIHALVRVDALSKFHWDAVRDKVKPFLTKCGADPGVFSAVRLTRLPGCLRHGTEGKEGYVRYAEPRRQELIYFRPGAEVGRNVFEQK